MYTYRFGSYAHALEKAGLEKDARRDLFSEEDILKKYKEVYEHYGKQPTATEYQKFTKGKKGFPSYSLILKRVGGFSELSLSLGLESARSKYEGYDKKFLIDELKRYKKEYGVQPSGSDLDKSPGFPNRKTYLNHFGSFGAALLEAGFEYRGIENYRRNKPLPKNKIKLERKDVEKDIIKFIEKFDIVPTLEELVKFSEYIGKNDVRRIYGDYSAVLEELNLTPRYKVSYSDRELREKFLNFVEKNGRIPTHLEFNGNKDYPSFWVYQDRFGTWNKAVEHYGFEPTKNGTGFCYEFEDGELVKSKYEYDVSIHLRKNRIRYERDVLYSNHIDSYTGRKNCDYVIELSSGLVFVEIAGFYTDRENKSPIELDYKTRLDEKIAMLENSDLNYRIFYPSDLNSRPLEELFDFVNCESVKW